MRQLAASDRLQFHSLQEVAGLKDSLHQAEQRVKGLQAAYEQEKGKAEVNMRFNAIMLEPGQIVLLQHHHSLRPRPFITWRQAAEKQLAELTQRALAAEKHAAALMEAKLGAEAAAAQARKAQKASLSPLIAQTQTSAAHSARRQRQSLRSRCQGRRHSRTSTSRCLQVHLTWTPSLRRTMSAGGGAGMREAGAAAGGRQGLEPLTQENFSSRAQPEFLSVFSQAAEQQREKLVQQVAASKDLAPKLSAAEAELARAQAMLAEVGYHLTRVYDIGRFCYVTHFMAPKLLTAEAQLPKE